MHLQNTIFWKNSVSLKALPSDSVYLLKIMSSLCVAMWWRHCVVVWCDGGTVTLNNECDYRRRRWWIEYEEVGKETGGKKDTNMDWQVPPTSMSEGYVMKDILWRRLLRGQMMKWSKCKSLFEGIILGWLPHVTYQCFFTTNCHHLHVSYNDVHMY